MVTVEADGVGAGISVARQTVAAALLALADLVNFVDIGCELHT